MCVCVYVCLSFIVLIDAGSDVNRKDALNRCVIYVYLSSIVPIDAGSDVNRNAANSTDVCVCVYINVCLSSIVPMDAGSDVYAKVIHVPTYTYISTEVRYISHARTAHQI